MPRFPVLDDDGHFDYSSVELTRPLLAFYVENRPLGEVEAYADGLWDACSLLTQAIAEPKTNDLTVEQFREQIRETLRERYELMEVLHAYISQTRCEKLAGPTPD